MEAEDLIPLAKRLETINKGIKLYQKLGEIISEHPDESIQIQVSSGKEKEDNSDFGLPPQLGGMGIMALVQRREDDKSNFKIKFEDVFALEIIGELLHTLNHERDYIIDKMSKYNNNKNKDT